jgi:hypothetical protein
MMRRAVRGLLAVLVLASYACTRPAPIEEASLSGETGGTPLPSLTPLPASRTPPPTGTVFLTPTLTPTMTDTPEPDASPTSVPLATDDPRFGLNLSSPHYIDDFSSNLTWVGPNFEGASNIIRDGKLVAVDQFADGFLWWSTTVPDLDAGNIYIEVEAEIEACSALDSYGVALRVDSVNRNSGYALEFSCDGQYRIRKLFSGNVQTLIDWTPSDSINIGPGAVNRMGFFADGPTLAAFSNGEFLGRVEDTAFFKGNYGLYANAGSTPGLTISFDDFYLWYINP